MSIESDRFAGSQCDYKLAAYSAIISVAALVFAEAGRSPASGMARMSSGSGLFVDQAGVSPFEDQRGYAPAQRQADNQDAEDDERCADGVA